MLPENMLALGESRSVIREIFEYGMKRRGEIGADNVYDFSLGNPSVPAPKKVGDTIAKLLQEEDSTVIHAYSSTTGNLSARAAAAKQESMRAGRDIPADCIYMSCGAAASLTISLRAMLCPGEKVVLLAPFFPEYVPFCQSAGAEVIIVPPVDSSMQPDLELFRAAVAQGAKAVIINSPNNPSGAIYSEETLTKIADILRAQEEANGSPIYLIADEPYRELVYGDAKVPFIPNIYADSVVCYSYSKSLSLPGERIGYIMVNPEAADSRRLYNAIVGAGRSMGYVCAPSLFQRVIAECADERPDLKAYETNRNLLYGALTEYGFECVRPDGAFYLFLKVPGGNASEFCEKAKKFELLLVPSDSFGMGGYVRIAYCVSEKTIRDSLPSFRKLAEECL